MNRRNLIAAGIIPMFYGCGSSPKTASLSLDQYAKTVYLPALGNTITANIGERMIATLRVAVIPVIVIADGISIDLPYSDTYRIATILKAGSYYLFRHDSIGGTYYKSKSRMPLTYKSIKDPAKIDPYGDHDGGIHVSASGVTSVFFIYPGQRADYEEPSNLYAASNIKYTASTGEIDLPQENLQKELVYSGLSQSTITVRYREYWKGVSRPDYFQEVKYDLSQGKAIGFRESRFEILDASNTAITYRTTVHLK